MEDQMPAPPNNRIAHLRSQRQGSFSEPANGGEVTVKQQRRAGPLSAVGSGNTEVAPGNYGQQGSRASRSAALFGDVMSRYGGRAGGTAA
jgi:hypothetical protein